MKKALILSLFLWSILPLQAEDGRDDPKYPVKDIDPALLKDAHVVIRDNVETFTILSINQCRYRIRKVITIFNEKADNLALLYQPYDKDSKITAFEAVVYNALGEQIRKLKKSEIKDESFVSGVSLYEDDRVQYVDMKQPEYPYTIEFVSEVTLYRYFNIPDFYPIAQENMSVEKSKYMLITPEELIPRFREFNFPSAAYKSLLEENVTYTWEVSNLTPVKTEPMSKPFLESVPRVEIAPTEFEYSGYSGDMSTWENFGKWMLKLNEGRAQLPPSTVNEIRNLTKGMGEREKVKTVYQYMQNRTRYVSIQLGIGGFQTFPAEVVDKVGYGDCKALSNYTSALLKEINIPSHYTLINNGISAAQIDENFTNPTFNHVILCVPLESDTLWLECTSQTNPFNFIGVTNSDRKVLLITEEGGKIARTPKYGLQHNVRTRKAKVVFDESGNASASVHSIYAGAQYQTSGISSVLQEGTEIQKKWIHYSTELPNYDLQSFQLENIKNEIPEGIAQLNIRLPSYATKTGKRFYFMPNLMSRMVGSLPSVEDRKSNFIRKLDAVYVDTIEYEFPSEYQLEFMPEPVVLESEFGKYTYQTNFIQGKLVYTRRLELYSGEFAPDKYEQFRLFISQVESQDKTKVVLTTKT